METRLLTNPGNECQRSVNNFWSSESDNQMKTWSLWHLIAVLAAIEAKIASVDITTIAQKRASTECPQFLFLHLGYRNSIAMISSYNGMVGCLYGLQWQQRDRYHLLKMSVNGASTIFGLASWTLKTLCIGFNPYWMYRLPLWAKIFVMILLQPANN